MASGAHHETACENRTLARARARVASLGPTRLVEVGACTNLIEAETQDRYSKNHATDRSVFCVRLVGGRTPCPNGVRCSTGAELVHRVGCPSSDKPELNANFGSGVGIRTLNLADNSPLRPVQKWRFVLAECR